MSQEQGKSYEDIKLECIDCRTWFELSATHQKWFDERGLQRPKRCQPCRDAKRRAKENR